jgi:DNA mismatch repair ATPase MutS
MTPMMQQYFDVKRGLPKDTLLLFRLGDFFELFFDDAVTVSKLLGLTLTKRQDTPMAGLPAQAVDNYVSKLLAAGSSRVSFLREQRSPPISSTPPATTTSLPSRSTPTGFTPPG